MNIQIESWKQEGRVFNFDDFEIFYLQKGHGENLLIIHGYPYSSFEWKETINILSNRFKVTVFDLLGMGFSDKPQSHAYSYTEHCDIVNSLLAHLNIKETHIFSHDLGVSVVQELLARDLENNNSFKILSSAFMNGGLFMDVYKPRFIQRLLSQSPTFIGKFISQKISKASINKSVRAVYGKDTQPSDAFLDLQWEILNYKDGKSIAYLIGRLVFDKNKHQQRWISAMQKTSIPLCYICGPADPNSGQHMAKRYEELIPKPLIFMLEAHIGHWPMQEAEITVIDSFYNFLNQITP